MDAAFAAETTALERLVHRRSRQLVIEADGDAPRVDGAPNACCQANGRHRSHDVHARPAGARNHPACARPSLPPRRVLERAPRAAPADLDTPRVGSAGERTGSRSLSPAYDDALEMCAAFWRLFDRLLEALEEVLPTDDHRRIDATANSDAIAPRTMRSPSLSKRWMSMRKR